MFMTDERRRSPRVAILGKLHGRLVALDVAVSVSEISLGGMGLQTDIALPTGAVHTFQLTLGDGSTVNLVGRVVYCQMLTGETERYASGIAFLEDARAE